jgi:hypothetical protein
MSQWNYEHLPEEQREAIAALERAVINDVARLHKSPRAQKRRDDAREYLALLMSRE